MASLSPTPKLQFFDNSGNPLVGGKLYTYLAGTLTPSATFTDSTEAAYNSNPVILDSRGEASIWLGSGVVYKFALQDAGGVPIYTVDNVSPASSGGGGGGGGTASVTVSDTAPSAPTAGNLWWKSDEGQMYIYYTDVNSSQWVVANAYAGGASYLPISGGTMTGAITFAAAQTFDGAKLTAASVTGAKIAAATVAISNLSATGTPTSNNYLRGDNSWQNVGSNPTVLTYNSSSTWTKATDVPAGCTMALIENWGGGGGASRSTGAGLQNGGGGGSYTYRLIQISSLGATETVTVGAAGLGATATAVGGVGGNSSFGSWLTAYGGAGGALTGGVSATFFATSNATGGGATGISGQYVGICYDGTNFYQNPQIYNGGVGGTSSVLASSSVYGGGGGGCLTNTAGGTSIFGGNGGTAAATPGAGTQPAGGGAASTSANTNGANGGAGRVRITMW